jgi:hypothetical protein
MLPTERLGDMHNEPSTGYPPAMGFRWNTSGASDRLSFAGLLIRQQVLLWGGFDCLN